MNLNSKKRLAARTFNVGLDRIIFNPARIDEIKEAITKQDMRDLFEGKAILIKEIRGRLKIEKRKTKRRAGKIKKTIKDRKGEYVRLTRKLRNFAKQLLVQGRVSREQHQNIRKQIKARAFRSKAHFKEIVKIEQRRAGEKTNKKNKKEKTNAK